MSVIYKLLKKNGSPAQAAPEEISQLRRRRHVYTFKRLAFSPPMFISILLLTSLTIIGISYGSGFIKMVMAQKKRATHLSEEVDEAIPFRFTVPRVPEEAYLEAPSSGITATAVSPEKKLKRGLPVLRDFHPEEDRTLQAIPSEKTSPPVQSMEEREEEARLLMVTQKARVAQLVAKIEKAIDQGPQAEVKDLLDNLTDLKGEDDKYVLKLKAFWHLKQKDPEKAGPFLVRVLEKDEMDLEACINMAIIELGSNHVDKARKRLVLLRDRYPENSEIREILRRLQ